LYQLGVFVLQIGSTNFGLGRIQQRLVDIQTEVVAVGHISCEMQNTA